MIGKRVKVIAQIIYDGVFIDIGAIGRIVDYEEDDGYVLVKFPEYEEPVWVSFDSNPNEGQVEFGEEKINYPERYNRDLFGNKPI